MLCLMQDDRSVESCFLQKQKPTSFKKWVFSIMYEVHGSKPSDYRTPYSHVGSPKSKSPNKIKEKIVEAAGIVRGRGRIFICQNYQKGNRRDQSHKFYDPQKVLAFLGGFSRSLRGYPPPRDSKNFCVKPLD